MVKHIRPTLYIIQLTLNEIPLLLLSYMANFAHTYPASNILGIVLTVLPRIVFY